MNRSPNSYSKVLGRRLPKRFMERHNLGHGSTSISLRVLRLTMGMVGPMYIIFKNHYITCKVVEHLGAGGVQGLKCHVATAQRPKALNASLVGVNMLLKFLGYLCVRCLRLGLLNHLTITT